MQEKLEEYLIWLLSNPSQGGLNQISVEEKANILDNVAKKLREE